LASTGAVSANSASAREARRNSAPGRARHTPSNHCAGKAVCSASPVCRCAVSLRYTRTADRGCQPAPGLPCALSFGGERKARLGRNALRGGEGASASRNVCWRTAMSPLAPSLRAQRNNPEFFRGGILDCFAALAMTIVEGACPHSWLSCPGSAARPGHEHDGQPRDIPTIVARSHRSYKKILCRRLRAAP
jgi:hypothetical protein